MAGWLSGVRILSFTTGVRLLKELAARSDVVMDNFRADVLPRMGLGPDDLRAVRDDLIVLKMPGLGCDGPRFRWGTWGSTLTAVSGMTYLWNHPDQPRPVGSQGVYPDYLTGGFAPAVVIAALLHRQRTGRGVFLDMARHKGVKRLDPGYGIKVDDLEACIEAQGVEVRTGDILIVRTGHVPLWYELEDKMQFWTIGAPGMSITTVDWLYEKEIAALALDNIAVEVEPFEEPYEHVYPTHSRLIRDPGLTLGDAQHLARGRTAAHRKLQGQIEDITG